MEEKKTFYPVGDHELDLSRATVNPQKRGEYVPQGGPKDKGNSDAITRAYFDAMLLSFRHIGAEKPDTAVTLLGHECKTPLMAGMLALLDRVHEGGTPAFAKGVQRAGALLWTNFTEEDSFRRVMDTGVTAIVCLKPFQDTEFFLNTAHRAAALGAAGICMDIDHCFDDRGEYCGFIGGQLAPKSPEELRKIGDECKKLGIPFILKGILDPADAVAARELGADAIFASHHRNIWSYAVPPAMALPSLREALGPDYPIFADCGVKSGVDAFKLLAAGANGAAVARELLTAFGRGGEDGVYDRLMFLNDELKGTMAKTARRTVEEIDQSAVLLRQGW